ncbi:hypothetical protein CC86DRAFT_355412 [Ophiobolus disseminans]|uniref:Uncharacterized protein n=1 Tax=Ophiobolus disseminans TaxID=1469910 RepID=A0A6A6ZU78_9PLEO|nr:hypothetical protein CC86DRAFT_355412 [Ophiobolus disseminans]
MPINWHDKAVQDRLLTAVIASVDTVKPAEIARLYGGDMTYHAVEKYLRKFRKEAKEMKTEAEGRKVAVPSPAKSRAKKVANASPIKAGVKSGRVTKKKNTSPVKVKPEALDEELGFGDVDSSGDNEG